MRIIVIIVAPMVTHKDMNMSQHTQTPWRLHDMESATIVDCFNHSTIADCNGSHRSGDFNVANAMYIIKCVNMHDELVHSGAAFLQWFRDFMGNEAMSEINSIALNAFESALAKVQS